MVRRDVAPTKLQVTTKNHDVLSVPEGCVEMTHEESVTDGATLLERVRDKLA